MEEEVELGPTSTNFKMILPKKGCMYFRQILKDLKYVKRHRQVKNVGKLVSKTR